MNKTWVLHQLQGAHYELGKMIEEIRADEEEDGGFPQLYAGLPFVYRKLNFAWKSRDLSDQQIDELLTSNQRETPEWKGFPHDLDPFIHD